MGFEIPILYWQYMYGNFSCHKQQTCTNKNKNFGKNSNLAHRDRSCYIGFKYIQVRIRDRFTSRAQFVSPHTSGVPRTIAQNTKYASRRRTNYPLVRPWFLPQVWKNRVLPEARLRIISEMFLELKFCERMRFLSLNPLPTSSFV